MQCLHIWITIGLCAISVNNLLASPVDISLNVGDKRQNAHLTASDDQDGAEVSERDNEVGYLRHSNEKGGDGYQHFESFHDKDGDAYGYEKHEAFGKSNKGESLNDEKDKDEGSLYTYVQELGDKPKYQKYHSSNDDPGKSKLTNYHYSYNSDDDDDDDEEEKPNRSANYKEDAKKSDSSEEDNDEEESGGSDDEPEDPNEATDEEKSPNFNYKTYSDDYAEDAANEKNGDINSKGSGNYGYNYGHGNKNTDVDYAKKSAYTAKGDDESGEEEDHEDGSNASVKDEESTKSDEEKDKDKNYSSYTTFTSQEGDEEDDGEDEIPKNAILYQNSHPPKSVSIQAIVEDENDDESEEEEVEVEAKQPEQPPTPKPIVIIHVQPTKSDVLVQEHRAEYKTDEHGGDQNSDDSGKGHAGSVSKHLYEIYVTHNTGSAKAGSSGSGHADGDGNGKSESLLLEQLTQPIENSGEHAEQDNGGYQVNINYGQNQNSPQNNGNNGKPKGSLKKKKKQIIKPHTYEVEEYIDAAGEKKALIKPGQESAPQHHRDNGDYSYGQQFIYASEADSDAYYW